MNLSISAILHVLPIQRNVKGLNETFSPIYSAKSQHFDFGAKQVRHKKFC